MTEKNPMTTARRFAWLAALTALLLAGCSEVEFTDGTLGEPVSFEPERPVAVDQNVSPYAGTNEHVLEAQESFPTVAELHRKVIWRTCTPNGGVCHNQKEYPDLHTPANFINAIDAPCNLQPGQVSSVYDRCERRGDRFRFGSSNQVQIGHVEYVPGEETDYGDESVPDETSVGLHLYLENAPSVDRENSYGEGYFVRTFVTKEGNVEDIEFFNFSTRWWFLGETENGFHVMAEVRNYQVNQINELLSVGVVEGDFNRNGIYGALEGNTVPMINPGSPEESYLIARLRGAMQGEPVPGSRMPLANKPLTISEMLALFCYVEGLPQDGSIPSSSWAIDYQNCSYSVDPENLGLLGEGITWEGRIKKILEANCGGCHSGETPAQGLNVLSDGLYDQLLGASTQNAELNLITPGDPDASYLWLKLTGGDGITGRRMPYNPLTGEGSLGEAELGDINTWIINGALKEE